MSHETSVLALDSEILKDQKASGYHPFDFRAQASYLLGASLGEAREDTEVLLIEGSLRVSF